jgi:hypothetical protein
MSKVITLLYYLGHIRRREWRVASTLGWKL